MTISVIGTTMTKFGELWDTSPRTLAHQAVDGALGDAGLEPSDIDALYVGNMLSGILGGQEHLGAFFAEELGLTGVPAWKTEGACASGGLAVHAAVTGLLSGQYRTVAVLGIEKMTDFKPEEVAVALMGAGSDSERTAGATFPGLYALLARVHMETYGTTEAQMAEVAVKNHFHASLNPNAQFHGRITVDSVLNSPKVADPLKLLDCSPISDGAAAVVMTTRNVRSAVRLEGNAVATDALGLSERSDLTGLAATVRASGQAYGIAGVKPRDIDVLEVHDCFTIAEIMAIEDLGIYQKGEAAGKIAAGMTRLGGKGPAVNTSGGLKGCGHPVGATGVKQVVEIVDQLRGKAGKRQAEGVKTGLTHNVGGSGATAVVNIFKTPK